MKRSHLPVSSGFRWSLASVGMLLLIWLFLRISVWPRLEYNWLLIGYTRQNGLSGNIPAESCPPPWEVSLTRRLFHPLTGGVGLAGGVVLLLWRSPCKKQNPD